MKRAVVFLLSSVVVVAGCRGQPEVGDVTGIVRFRGQPLKSGTVIIRGADRQEKGAAIGPDGRYRVRAVAVGPGRIRVVSHPRAPEGLGGGKRDDPHVKIPPHYEDLNTSGLTVEVRPGKQDHDIDLTDESPGARGK
jgi:hypothetical protein